MRRWVETALLILGTSCISESHRVPSSSGMIQAVDSVVLRAEGDLDLGIMSYLVEGENGPLYVSDVARGRICRFNRDGTLDRVLGAKGNGPGEFAVAEAMTLLVHDSLLAVTDGARQYISLLDTGSGAFLRGMKVPFYAVGAA
jgi:hypothetical protein